MKNHISFPSKPVRFLIAVTLLLFTLMQSHSVVNAGVSVDNGAYVTTAANGEKIPSPASKFTYAVKDGAISVQAPGMPKRSPQRLPIIPSHKGRTAGWP